MNRLLNLLLLFLPLFAKSQYIGTGANINDTTTERYVQNSPTNAAGNRRVIEKIKDSTYWSIRTNRAFIRAVDSLHSETNNPTNLIWVSGFGEVRRTNLLSVILDTANIYGTKTWIQSRGYITSVSGALGYTPVSESGTYSNPSWITSLSWSKITGAPTTLSGYGIVDAVSNSALTAGLATKENVIAAGTTSQYWRGDKTWQTLNTTAVTESSNLYYTDTRARASISAGTGISYNNSTGVITNTSADQVVNLTAGRGISISGTYPNYTISLVAPTINIVTRALNSNFTPNTTKETYVSYSVTCSVTNPLLVGTSTAMAFLEYSTNGGSTWLLPAQNGNSSGVGVTVTLQLTNGQTGNLVGFIPANALTRIRTTTSGTASVAYTTGTEMNY